MRRSALMAFVFLVFVALLPASVPSLRVAEDQMRARIGERDIRLIVPVHNAGARVSGTVHLELLAPDGRVQGSRDQNAQFAPGATTLALTMERPAIQVSTDTVDPIFWYRLRYRITAAGETAEAIVALGAITPDLFELRSAHPGKAIPGRPYQVRVSTANPVTRAPIAGVAIKGHLAFGDDEAPAMDALRITDAKGDATLSFLLPPHVTSDDFDLTITAQKHGLVRQDDFSAEFIHPSLIIVSTDKSLYQPGQPLHARALVLGPDRHAVANAAATFTLQGPESTLVFRASVKTNRFGIANIDWQLAEDLRLGHYWIEVETDGTGPYSASGNADVRVSRYELPTFAVNAQLDRAYYLPAQDAALDVSADYLFGKPVRRGAVRVARERSRSWNFKEQKWETREEESYTGELDGAGHCKLHLDLSAAQADFHDASSPFRDLEYAAYVTDASTGRTQQRRFKLRLTHQPIHVYVVRGRFVNDVADFYVSTFYPDGAPASCRVQISEVPDKNAHGGPGGEQLLRTVNTNRYGLAKVIALPLRNPEESSLSLVARDSSGATGTGDAGLSSQDDPFVVTTDKTLYQSGEALTVSIRGPQQARSVVVDLLQQGGVLASQHLLLRNGKAWTVFPYVPRFQGELTVVAYSLEEEFVREYGSVANRAVLYPHNSELQVSLRPTQRSYQPGQEASARVRVQSPSGSAQESALGVVVLDKAVEERARTDNEFGGGGSGGFWDWGRWYAGDAFGGVSRGDLDKIDMSQPLPDGLDLVAELILDRGGWWWGYARPEFSGYDYDHQTETRFRADIARDLAPLAALLRQPDTPGWKFPTDRKELNTLLAASGIDGASLKDPWDTPFAFRFSVNYRYRIVEAISAGPDKRFDTADDFPGGDYRFEYFASTGMLMDNAVRAAYARSGGFVRDFPTLRAEVLRLGVDLSAARDPWGQPYRFDFEINGPRLQINVSTLPPKADPLYGAIALWTTSTEYFAGARSKLDAALAAHSGLFPRTNAELDAALRPAGIAVSELRDPWGNPYYATYARNSSYGDTVVVQYSRDQQFQGTTPVTRQMDWINIRSAGPDGKPGTNDDFTVTSFSQLVTTQSARDLTPRRVPSEPLAAGTGAIRGVISDQLGAVIPHASIIATCAGDPRQYAVDTDSKGAFVIRDLRPSRCTLAVSARGFRTTTVIEVPVTSADVTAVNVTLLVGSVSETVEVVAGQEIVNTTCAEVASVRPGLPTTESSKPAFTPRLRQFFPETLYWEPSLVTDRGGNARLRFKLADSITTWKLAVVASSEAGEVGMAETDITAFQPFFVEHDPPPVLTVGDQIALPVVVRNYLDRSQKVDVQLHPADWFAFTGPDKQAMEIAAGESSRAEFPFRAQAAVHEAGQRITAANRAIGDAVEKPVSVHPDGEESTSAITRMVTGNTVLDLQVPAGVLPGSLRAELKFYPDPLAHVVESIEGGLHRPYGCGEQTISSTYPSALLLKYYKDHGGSDAVLARRATKYLHDGYQRLLHYRDASGGFTYWGSGDPDVSLTAYAVRFLGDAGALMDVDPAVAAGARRWLVEKQNQDGSWGNPALHGDAITGYVTRILARPGAQEAPVQQSVQRALAWLEPRVAAKDDPYPLAMFALSAAGIGDRARAAQAASRLAQLAHHESDRAYWLLETNTPFYGWGRAGRVETTALALQALLTVNPQQKEPLNEAGLLFLLDNKDRYGVWYSGQTTVTVLDALMLLTPGAAAGGPADIVVNGKPAGQLAIGAGARFSGPLTADLTRFVTPGVNRIEIRRAGGSPATAQAVAAYYLPWRRAADVREQTRADEARALRLAVHFDKLNAQVGEQVRCSVSAERIGHRGYGMMLAEIGLPPGAEVDRASLQRATEDGVQRYDILPDRVIVYLWPQAGGVNFAFTFRPRMAMQARTAPSSLFDYYNPDAQVVLPPADFVVRGTPQAAGTSGTQ